MHTSLEAAPPPEPGQDGPDVYQYLVPVRMDGAALTRAAEQWDLNLSPVPPR